MKRTLTVAIVALLCALLVLGVIQSVIGAVITFVVVLCLGLYPADFGFGREEPDPVLDPYGGEDEPTAEERARFIDVPAYEEDGRHQL